MGNEKLRKKWTWIPTVTIKQMGLGAEKEKPENERRGIKEGGRDGWSNQPSGRTDWIGSTFFFKIKIHFISFLKKQTLQKKSE